MTLDEAIRQLKARARGGKRITIAAARALMTHLETMGADVASLEMILHDLRRDSDAYRHGWREAVALCIDESSGATRYSRCALTYRWRGPDVRTVRSVLFR
jgi:hypothetical protein